MKKAIIFCMLLAFQALSISSQESKQEIARRALPMGGTIKDGWAYVSPSDSGSVNPFFENSMLYTFRKRGSYVGIWEKRENVFRITPDGFVPEGWVEAYEIRLSPKTSARPSAHYLQAIKQRHKENIERRTVNYCGTVIKTTHMSNWGNIEEGEIFLINKKVGGTYRLASPTSWQISIRRLDVAPTHPNTQRIPIYNPTSRNSIYTAPKEACVDNYSIKVLFIDSGGYRRGPSQELPPVDFYEKGQTTHVVKKYPGWFAVKYDPHHPSQSQWFSASDAIVLSFPMTGYTTDDTSIRPDRSTDSEALFSIPGKDSYLGVFEMSNDWFRVTPDSFTPEGWVPAEFVRLTTEKPDEALANYYLEPIAPPPIPTPPPTPLPEPTGPESPKPRIWFLLALTLSLLISLIALIANRKHRSKPSIHILPNNPRGDRTMKDEEQLAPLPPQGLEHTHGNLIQGVWHPLKSTIVGRFMTWALGQNRQSIDEATKVIDAQANHTLAQARLENLDNTLATQESESQLKRIKAESAVKLAKLDDKIQMKERRNKLATLDDPNPSAHIEQSPSQHTTDREQSEDTQESE